MENAALSHSLLAWFLSHRRELPWREESDPYRIWVSEVMLQQTRAETAAAYYLRFLSRFPDIASLADASEEEVLKAWEGLGYYGRARNLHRAARLVSERHGGRFPSEPETVTALPGIGPYTAAAVLSIAFARRLGVVDGNVIRAAVRIMADPGDPAGSALRLRVRAFVEESFLEYHPGWINQAWMELGALVCRPLPRCAACPVTFACRAYGEGRIAEFPARRPAAPLPIRRGCLYLLAPADSAGGLRKKLARAVSAPRRLGEAILERAVPLLLVRRPSRGLLGGLWEFPNILEPDEVTNACSHGVEVVGTALEELRHRYSHFEVRFRPVLGFAAREARFEAWVERRWVPPAELGSYPRPRVHIKAMQLLGLEG